MNLEEILSNLKVLETLDPEDDMITIMIGILNRISEAQKELKYIVPDSDYYEGFKAAIDLITTGKKDEEIEEAEEVENEEKEENF